VSQPDCQPSPHGWREWMKLLYRLRRHGMHDTRRMSKKHRQEE
jgi:hypothetical protein